MENHLFGLVILVCLFTGGVVWLAIIGAALYWAGWVSLLKLVGFYDMILGLVFFIRKSFRV